MIISTDKYGVKYTLQPSTSRRLTITVHPDRRVVVSVPKHAKPADVERFVREKEKWVLAKQAYFEKWRQKREKMQAVREKQSLQFQEELRHKYDDVNESFFSKTKLTPTERKYQYLLHKESARAFLDHRLAHWRAAFQSQGGKEAEGIRYRRVSVKNQKTRWGSCSRRGNLNFNWRIAQLPLRMADYIIIHELAHLKELNHGPRFWKLVALLEPDYKEVRADLRKMGVILG